MAQEPDGEQNQTPDAQRDPAEVPEQIVLMREMVELARTRTRMAADRSRMSEDRSRMSAERSRMSSDRSRMSEERSRLSADRSRMSEDRSRMSEDRSRMSEDRSRMSEERSELSRERSRMSAERSYMNAERTLSVWVRTALSLMIFGIAIARFELLIRETPAKGLHLGAGVDAFSNWIGIAFIVFGILMVLTTGARFLAYVRDYRQRWAIPRHHGPYLAPLFALLVAVFGTILLIAMLWFAG